MRRSLVAGNWKMHGSRETIAALLEALIQEDEDRRGEVEIVIFPPFPYLQFCQQRLGESKIALGAQNIHRESFGAFTGEVSGPMLTDFGVRYVIVGHSERRQLARENDADVAQKFASARRHGICPILCVGETLGERDAGNAEFVVARQLDSVIAYCGIAELATAVIAYEPVWAIGTGRTATPDVAQDMHRRIRGIVAQHDVNVAQELRIIYGGSVSATNASALFAQADIDGGLVGGASLKAKEFITICNSVG